MNFEMVSYDMAGRCLDRSTFTTIKAAYDNATSDEFCTSFNIENLVEFRFKYNQKTNKGVLEASMIGQGPFMVVIERRPGVPEVPSPFFANRRPSWHAVLGPSETAKILKTIAHEPPRFVRDIQRVEINGMTVFGS